jgi:uncharacterized membrane protein
VSDLVAIAYQNEHEASKMMEALKQLNDRGAVDLESAVAIRKDGERRLAVENAFGDSTGKGAAGGLVVGAVLGLLLTAPVAGALFGLASGALAGRHNDIRQIDDFQIEVGERLVPGSSALPMLVRSTASPAQGLAAPGEHGGTLIRTTLPDDATERIRAAHQSSAGSD